MKSFHEIKNKYIQRNIFVYLFIYLFAFYSEMPSTIPTLLPYAHEFLRCAICLHDFEYDNSSYRPITLPNCGHTMCGQCIEIIRKQTKCPQDQVSYGTTIPLEQLPINYPLLLLLFDPDRVIH